MAKLPVYNAIEISKTKSLGGTTLPFLAVADDGNPYVLKLFKKKHAKQRCYTAAEAYAHFLAKEFDLNIPQAAFITIPENLMELIKDKSPEQYADLITRDYNKPCFATRYLGGFPTFSPAFTKKYIQSFDIETIYAFDTLILNGDRRIANPNILKNKENFVLIDHDKAFEGIEYAFAQFNNGLLCQYSSNHLFFKILRLKAKKEGVKNMFDTFQFYMQKMRVRELVELRKQLTGFQYDTDGCQSWEAYLEEMKQNIPNFVENLRKSLS